MRGGVSFFNMSQDEAGCPDRAGGRIWQHSALTSKQKQRGQELVEFAIVLPLLLLILFGAIDLGRAFHAAITIANAAREGARYIALHPDEIANGRYQAVLEAQGGGITITTADVDVSCPDTEPPPGGCDRMQTVRVTVRYTFNLMIPFIPVFGDMPGPVIQMQRTAEMLVQ